MLMSELTEKFKEINVLKAQAEINLQIRPEEFDVLNDGTKDCKIYFKGNMEL